MIPKIKIFSLIVLAILLLTGCKSTQHKDKQQHSYSLSGQVADGYITGAKVCLDTDKNDMCDSGDPLSITIKNGQFDFTHLTHTQINAPLIAQITKNSIDTDTNQTTNIPYIMLAPGKSTFISPLTTLIRYKTQLGDSLIPAMVDISKKTGVSLLYVDNNFMKSNSLAAKKAKFASKVIVKTTQQIIQTLRAKDIVPNAPLNINTTRYLSQEIIDHAIIIKRFLSSISKQNIKTVKTDMNNATGQLTKAILADLSHYNSEIKTINEKIQKVKKQNLSLNTHHDANKAHGKSDAKNIGAIIFVLTLQLFFFVFLAFFL